MSPKALSPTTHDIKSGKPSIIFFYKKLMGMHLCDFLPVCLFMCTFTASYQYPLVLSYQLTDYFGVSQFVFGLTLAIPMMVPGSLITPVLRKVGFSGKKLLLASISLVSLGIGLIAVSLTLRNFGLFFFASMLFQALASPCAIVSMNTVIAERCQVSGRVPSLMMVLSIASGLTSIGTHFFYSPSLLEATIGYDGALYIVFGCNVAAAAVVWFFCSAEDITEKKGEKEKGAFSYWESVKKVPVGIWYLAMLGLAFNFIQQFLRFIPNYFQSIGVPVEVALESSSLVYAVKVVSLIPAGLALSLLGSDRTGFGRAAVLLFGGLLLFGSSVMLAFWKDLSTMVYVYSCFASAGKQFVSLFVQSLPRAILLQHFAQGTEELEAMIVTSYAIISAAQFGPITAVGTMLVYSTDILGPVSTVATVCSMAGLVLVLTLVPFFWNSFRLALVDDSETKCVGEASVLEEEATFAGTPVVGLADTPSMASIPISEVKRSRTSSVGSADDDLDIVDQVV